MLSGLKMIYGINCDVIYVWKTGFDRRKLRFELEQNWKE